MRYCAQCGEPVDAALVAELQDLYTALQRLDGWVRAGKGGYTIETLRTETVARYLDLRTAPALSPVATPAASERLAAGAVALAVAASDSGHPAEIPDATPGVVPAETSGGGVPSPVGPVFSWRAFIAEQAIAIMAYLGGFLLLVATLSFEVGGWQVLDSAVKLAAVCVVYGIFGVLGVALPRASRLRTVGRAYLGVFALMTPLVALAVYRFELRQRGFSPYGMLCLAAAYAAVVYLALAWRTRFATYAYLAWSAALVAVLAVVPWLDVDRTWWLPSLVAASLGLLLPRRLRRFGTVGAVEEPATQLSAVASVVAAMALEAVGLGIVSGMGTPGAGMSVLPPVFALATVVLVPLAVLWGVTLRERVALDVGAVNADASAATERPVGYDTGIVSGIVDGVDWLTAAFAAQAAVGVAWWFGADGRTMSSVLAAAAVGELALAMALRRFSAERAGLRFGVEGLALALAAIAPALVWPGDAPNWPLIVALAAGLVVTASVAVAEAAPWWLLASGLCLTLGYRALLHAVLPASVIALPFFPYDNSQIMSACVAGLALAVWLAALALTMWPAARRYAPPLFFVALGDALYASVMLIGQPAAQQTAILALFALAALGAARRQRAPVMANLLFAFFGALAVYPYAGADVRGIRVAVAALVPVLVALGVRRALGRRWAYGSYAVGLWAALLAFQQLQRPDVTTADASLLGISFASWTLLVVAALAAVAASWEDVRWALVVPAGLSLLATVYMPDLRSLVVLVFVLAGLGAAWRQVKGPWWGAAWHGAALLASGVAGFRLLALEPHQPAWVLAISLAFGAAVYLVAAHERAPWVTPLATAYAVVAIWQIPGTNTLLSTLLLTFALVGVGVALRLRFGVVWALAVYGAATVGSIFAVARVAPSNVGLMEALLLVFAGIAYAVAALERAPLAGGVPALYACAAVAVRPDAHALLPLALALGVLAVGVGRVAGPRWSWPLYAAATVNAAAAALLASGDLRFEAIGLAAIAALVYAVAALESRADLLPVAFLIGGLALASAEGALNWVEWQRIVAFAALGWLYYLGAAAWRRIPWLRDRGGAWWAKLDVNAEVVRRTRDVRLFGTQIHWWSGILVAAATCLAAIVAAPDSFAVRAAAAEAVVAALLSCGVMLAVHARTPRMHVLWYAAGELLALAVTWQARTLGANNVQAFILAPGSYQIVVGALLPADARLRHPVRLGQAFSLVGSLVLLLPTLAQSFNGETEWVYALVLAVEALAIAGAGVGTHSRLLMLTGSVFVGVAALRGAGLAVTSGVPVAVVIAGLALLLMGGATWLSLRVRRGVEPMS